MIFNFKPITLKDKETVLELFKETARKIDRMNVDHWQYWHNPPIEKIQWLDEGIRKEEYFFIDNNIGDNIGMIRILAEDLLYWGKQEEKAKYVHSFVVREAYNGKKIGTEILAEIGSKAKIEGCKYLRLDADFTNPKLCSYYENMGFAKVGLKEMSISSYNLYQKEL